MLIVYAHPNKDGHCGYALKKITDTLNKRGANYDLIDLYKSGFDPVLKANEHYSSGHYDVSEEVKKLQKKVLDNGELIFIYPTWWNGAPAILKGFFDRVMISRFAFEYVNGFPKGLLKGKKATVISTTGSPKLIAKIILGNRSLKVSCGDTLRFCGIKTKGYMIGSCKELNETQKNKIKKLVKKLFKNK